ncbi:hypothetical protein V6Z11_D12G113200 [Gossypium hirsutum]
MTKICGRTYFEIRPLKVKNTRILRKWVGSRAGSPTRRRFGTEGLNPKRRRSPLILKSKFFLKKKHFYFISFFLKRTEGGQSLLGFSPLTPECHCSFAPAAAAMSPLKLHRRWRSEEIGPTVGTGLEYVGCARATCATCRAAVRWCVETVAAALRQGRRLLLGFFLLLFCILGLVGIIGPHTCKDGLFLVLFFLYLFIWARA